MVPTTTFSATTVVAFSRMTFVNMRYLMLSIRKCPHAQLKTNRNLFEARNLAESC